MAKNLVIVESPSKTKPIEKTAVENISSPTTNCQKIIRNNQLLILRDDKTYNIVGQIVE